jgi:phosphohistidine phosphatase
MQIYLLRHGIAEDERAGMPDRDRALVPEGRKKLKEVLRLARQADTAVSLILSSPYRRARQTADMVVEFLASEAESLESATLTPDGRPDSVWQEIRAHKTVDSVMLVSHEPLMSATAAYLLNAPALRTDFKKGALMRIDVESFGAQPHGTLRWLVIPKLAAAQS